jgi:ribose 5-phosphate isomerase A
MDDGERLPRLAQHVASIVQNGSALGLGSGSTAEAVIRALGERVAKGSVFSGVPTSKRTAELARACGINLVEFDGSTRLDLGIDGADEISPELHLVKGRGGALLNEKLVALSCDRFVIVAASEKLVDQLGTRLPLPVEVVQFGWEQTRQRLGALNLKPQLRTKPNGSPFVTDGGHFIVDCATGPIEDPAKLAIAIKQTTGVVDHGLFIGMASEAITVDRDGNINYVRRSG